MLKVAPPAEEELLPLYHCVLHQKLLGLKSAALPGKASGRQHLLPRCEAGQEAIRSGVCVIPAAEASNLIQTLVQCGTVGLG